MLTVSERLTLLVGSGLYLVALKADPTLGPLLLVMGYQLCVTLMVTTPRP